MKITVYLFTNYETGIKEVFSSPGDINLPKGYLVVDPRQPLPPPRPDRIRVSVEPMHVKG